MSLQDSFNQNDGVLNSMGHMPPITNAHMKRKLLLLPMLAALLVGSSCSRKPVDVTGQIIVVTAGRENVKMGLIPVHVVSDEEFKKIAASLSRKIREDVAKETQHDMDSDARTAFLRETLAIEEKLSVWTCQSFWRCVKRPLEMRRKNSSSVWRMAV